MRAGNNDATKRRRYRMGRRQAAIEQTRDRITRAAFELHSTVGPALTSISAVAGRAGVQRHTVYNHFPDMQSLIEACTAHGMRVTVLPDPIALASVADPVERLRQGLEALYAYYRANARLLGNVIRDMAVMPELVAGSRAFADGMATIAGALASGWVVAPEHAGLHGAALGHAVDFGTWQSLTRFGLTDAEAVRLMVSFVESTASS
jgi:AcrR family transcriptional regulator